MKKMKTIGISLLPVCSWLLVQVIVSAGGAMILFLLPAILRMMGLNDSGIMAYLEREYLYLISVAMNAVFLIPGFFWYRFLVRKEACTEQGKAVFHFRAWMRLLLFGMCLQLVVSLFLSGAEILFPKIMENYGQVMESLGVNKPSFWSALYVAILAPVTEELIFRVLTLKILQRAFPFTVANVIQAFYFAVIHGNLVQGLYAFVIGLLLGKIAEKYGTLKGSVLCHFSVNVSGLLLGSIPMGLPAMAAGAVALACLIVLLRDRDTIQIE